MKNFKSINEKISKLKKNKTIKKTIGKKIITFKKIKKQNNLKIFNELCFCILTANFDAKKTIKIQRKIKNGFVTFSLEKLKEKLKEYGHRFPNKRAEYIVDSRKHINNLKEILKEKKDKREWFKKNIKGLGYKESSHFLRNIGYMNYAIIDFHILDLLESEKIIKKPKNINKKKYFEIEKILKKIAKKNEMDLGTLDLYLWFIQTKKILK